MLAPLSNKVVDIPEVLFADDTQLYKSIKPTFSIPSTALITFAHDLKLWMTNGYLKFNSNKTEILFIDSLVNSLTTSCID